MPNPNKDLSAERKAEIKAERKRYVNDTEARLADCLRLRRQGKMVSEIADEIFGVDDQSGIGRVQELLASQPRHIRHMTGELATREPVQAGSTWQRHIE